MRFRAVPPKPSSPGRVTQAAWRTKPTIYQVSTKDRTINPGLERFMAKRMKATTIELEASHLGIISHSREIANLILQAAGQKALLREGRPDLSRSVANLRRIDRWRWRELWHRCSRQRRGRDSRASGRPAVFGLRNDGGAAARSRPRYAAFHVAWLGFCD